MPTAPALPPGIAQQSATGGIDPQNFLLAAADLHQKGQLASDVPVGKPLQTGKPASRKAKLKVLK